MLSVHSNAGRVSIRVRPASRARCRVRVTVRVSVSIKVRPASLAWRRAAAVAWFR